MDDMIIVFTTDNGGPIKGGNTTCPICGDAVGASNAPVRLYGLFSGMLTKKVFTKYSYEAANTPCGRVACMARCVSACVYNTRLSNHRACLQAAVWSTYLTKTGTNRTGLMHISDWLPTIVAASGVPYTPNPDLPLHGYNQWDMITTDAPSPRSEILLNIDPYQNPVDVSHFLFVIKF